VEQFRLRSLALGVYAPALLYGTGRGAIIPVVVFTALDLGASPAIAGVVGGLAGVGNLVADLPAGQLAARIGEHRAMHVAVVVAVVALVGCMAAPNVAVFGVAVFCTGLSAAVWLLARQVYVTEHVPYAYRARALSMLGGVHRVGFFAGPLLGAGAIALLGDDGPYWLFLGFALASSALLVAIRSRLPDTRTAEDASLRGLVAMIGRERRPLATLGTGALVVSALRNSRQVLIPLWASHIGVDAATTSLIFGAAAAVDMALFHPAGLAMDRIGRRPVAVVSVGMIAIAHLLLPLTVSAAWLTAVAVLMGVGNGMGSGLVMTIGADASPAGARSQFLAAFRVLTDTGMMAGPLLVGVVTTLAGLGTASVAMGIVGGLGAAALNKWIPAGPGSGVSDGSRS
jgi:MFS family permease